MNMKQAKDYIRRLRKVVKELRAQLNGKDMQKKTAGTPAGAQKK